MSCYQSFVRYMKRRRNLTTTAVAEVAKRMVKTENGNRNMTCRRIHRYAVTCVYVCMPTCSPWVWLIDQYDRCDAPSRSLLLSVAERVAPHLMVIAMRPPAKTETFADQNYVRYDQSWGGRDTMSTVLLHILNVCMNPFCV